MKNYALFLFAFLSIALTSCNDDDDGTNTISDPIVGTWVLNDLNMEGTITFITNDTEVVYDTESTLNSTNQEITFSDDGTYTAEGNDLTVTYEYFQDGNLILSTEPTPLPVGNQTNEIESGTWEAVDNAYILDGSNSFSIEDGNLVFALDFLLDTRDEDIPLGGDLEFIQDFNIALIYEKQ